MPNSTNPAWRGGARQIVSFWSNGAADNKDLFSDTQAYWPAAWSLPARVMIALSTGNGWTPWDRRDDLPETSQFIGNVIRCDLHAPASRRSNEPTS